MSSRQLTLVWQVRGVAVGESGPGTARRPVQRRWGMLAWSGETGGGCGTVRPVGPKDHRPARGGRSMIIRTDLSDRPTSSPSFA